MFNLCFIRGLRISFLFAAVLASQAMGATSLRFEVGLADKLVSAPQSGRLFVILNRNEKPEPRLLLGNAGPKAPFVLAADITDFAPGMAGMLDQNAITFPITNLSALPAGDYYVQALLDSNRDLRSPAAPGNLYSWPRRIHLDPAKGGTVKLEMTRKIPPEQLPADTEFIKYIKIQSKLLSEFHGRPIFLRAGIILPRDYAREPNRKYPLWVRIGGYGARYSSIATFMNDGAEFRKTWMDAHTPQMILLQLDGAGPNGDPYQVNSAINGPYGDAVVRELIPYVEEKFRAVGQPHARVLSGLSTGGWASLALQVFYPDFFNGVWCFCPDPVDFRAFELVNIYEDDDAYIDKSGAERPSERSVSGEILLTMRREVGAENVMGAGDNWAFSGGQWCAWNAVYGPCERDGSPPVLWDPQSGKINHDVVEKWKKNDLRLVMERNWKTLGPKLSGKLHISVGEADNYYLNNAVHLLDNFLSHADPPYRGRIVYGPGKGHGWTDIPLPQMLKEMADATAKAAQK